MDSTSLLTTLIEYTEPSYHLIVMPVNEGQLELVFGRVDVENSSSNLSIHTEHLAAFHSRYIDGHVQSSHYTRISATEMNTR